MTALCADCDGTRFVAGLYACVRCTCGVVERDDDGPLVEPDDEREWVGSDAYWRALGSDAA